MGETKIIRGPGFSITDHRGVHLAFENGVTVSIQWGPFNYCGDYWEFKPVDYDAPTRSRRWFSPDAEIALFWSDGKGKEWLTREAHAALNDGAECGDDVLPAVKPAEAVRYIAWAAAHQPRDKALDLAGVVPAAASGPKAVWPRGKQPEAED